MERIKVGRGGRRQRLGCTAAVLIALSATACTAASSGPSARVSGSAATPSASSIISIETPSPGATPTPSPTIVPTLAPTFGPPGKFVPTGSMTVGRDAQTATLLLDGRVLIAGGEGYDAARSAELYDPKTGTFSRTGSPAVALDDSDATLLLDGRVLTVGGFEWTSKDNSVESASAQLYDPKTGTFSRTGSLPAPRHFQTATLLKDGRVLIAGGETPAEGMGTATALLYDPATGKFSPTGSMTRARIFHTATLLRDGRVLIAGGNGDSSAEVYDPTTGTFSATGSMTIPDSHTATLLKDGRVLIAGGSEAESGITRSYAEVYDPATGTFTPTGSMINETNCTGSIGDPISAPLLADGRVLVPDASSDSENPIGSAELYDPITGTFSQAGPMNRLRNGFTDTLLADGRVLFAGDTGVLFFAGAPTLTTKEVAGNAAARASAELYVP